MLERLPASTLRQLAMAAAVGKLDAPCAAAGLRTLVPEEAAADVASDLSRLGSGGLAAALEALAASAEARPAVEDLVEVVTTAPGGEGAGRSTAAVVPGLFARAEQSVLVAGYAVQRGERIFEALAARMHERPALEVRLCLDIKRGPGDTSAPGALAAGFAARFRERDWPRGAPLPEIYYDPRSLEAARGASVALHAKCVVVDEALALVSSANFTPAAQERNLELGLLVRSAAVAGQIARFFEGLIAGGQLRRLA